MYLKNIDHYPGKEHFYKGLRKEKRYWFPHCCKYFAWILVFGSIGTSSVFLIMYGMSFGMIKTYLWLTGILYAFVIGVLVSTPAKIFLTSLFDSLLVKSKPIVLKRRVNYSYLENPPDLEAEKTVKESRRYNKKLYEPQPLDRYKDRLEDIKYNIELRNMAVELIVYLFFLVTIFFVVLIHVTDMGYHSTQVLKNLIIQGRYTNSMPYTNVTTYAAFLNYLNRTLLPAMLIDYQDYELHYEYKDLTGIGDLGFRSHRSSENVAPHTRQKRFSGLRTNDSQLLDKDSHVRGWTLDHAIKLLGVIRLRQIRVATDYCRQHYALKGRNPVCVPSLDSFNEETKNFSLGWSAYPPRGLTPMEIQPWLYKTGWETATLSLWCKVSSYPAGGYVLNLARNIFDSRVILKFMNHFQWIDIKTRAIFVEFTTYSANSNLFNVVTLIAEKAATGYIVPSYRIRTCRFLFMKTEVETLTVCMATFFTIVLFFCLFREGLRIHRTSLKHYLARPIALIDLGILALGVLCVSFTILRYSYVIFLLRELEKSNNNEFVSFAYASYYFETTTYIKASLLCLSASKSLRLLAFRASFYQLQTTLAFCFQKFFSLLIQTVAVIMAFGLFFYLTLLYFSLKFSTLPMTLSTLIGSSVALSNTFDFEPLNHSTARIAPFFYAAFIIVVTLLFVNVFIAVSCLYLREVRKVSLINKYNVFDYLRYSLSRPQDIMKLRNLKVFPKEEREPRRWLLRLKGGDSSLKLDKWSRLKFDRRRFKKSFDRLTIRELATPKPYDFTRYRGLMPEHESALRSLTIAGLTDDPEKKKKERQQALMALFLIFTVERYVPPTKDTGDYFIVDTPDGRELKHKFIFCKMKLEVEKLAREMQWTTREKNDLYDIERVVERMTLLDKKLDFYLQHQENKMYVH